MAKPKPKAKDRRGEADPTSRHRDLEALALFLFGLAVFLGFYLYAPAALVGDLGAWVRHLLYGHVGVASYLLPPILVGWGLLAVLGKPVRTFFFWAGLVLLGALVTTPLFTALKPGLGGELGRVTLEWLRQHLGAAGLLVPLLLLTGVVDLMLRQTPGKLVAMGIRRGGQAGGRVWRAYRLSRQATRLLRQARLLRERYPDHKAIAALERDLVTFLKAPRDADTLAGYRSTLEGFLSERAQELIAQINAEPRPLLPRLEGLTQALAAPVSGSGELAKALEERRAALKLETSALRQKALSLNKAAEVAGKSLGGQLEVQTLFSAWERHRARLEQWAELDGLIPELEERTDAWLRWVEWLEGTPEEAHPGGLRILLAGGLTASPPAWVEAPKKPPEPGPQNLLEGDSPLDLDIVFPDPLQEPVTQPVKPALAPKTSKSLPMRGSPQPASTALTLPDVKLLDPPEPPKYDPKALEAATRRVADTIDATLKSFGIEARVVAWSRGPTVTRFELEPAPGEKISRVANLANDLARALAAGSVRIEAPIPGKSVIGLEVPNAERELVRYSEAISHANFARSRERLPLVLGKSIDGEIWVRDLAKMPHLLIAGSTGSGKSVAINTLISSLLFKFLPTELRFLMIDPKMVELTPYEGIPHLIRPVVTNPADAAGVLLGAVAHMERRYKMMSQVGARNLEQFNEKMKAIGEPALPYLVIVIDELADLMITAPKEVEQAILRLAQMARATGMHLILATQRPSVDILTSLIKVNIPARMAFAVSSGFDSRTILDTVGAERLVGQGDMLFHQPGLPKPVRLQGPFLSEGEVHRIADFLRAQSFEDSFGERYGSDFDGPPHLGSDGGGPSGEVDFGDPLLKKAAEIVIEEGYASVSRLQRRLSVGHARAGKLVDALEAMGIVGPHQGSKPREVLITRDQLGEYFGRDAS
ncbi:MULTISPECIES: DNA translocase FtsK [unclassified Meiothermus]|uniref:DNA translocase FtsK n=1 Tax=unclassified Meiothermus TaxID=370471 RepID=UPI000D7C449F|nr:MULTISPECIES: DNA translocase FtsK [unclassified Meiothermus]PZA07968.1 DNA translocase FtsK [Meiothermus sp. Pnk-1]RYM35347.1 DNA translocase FtsK [Meiothermus sp. PNK-Is4]